MTHAQCNAISGNVTADTHSQGAFGIRAGKVNTALSGVPLDLERKSKPRLSGDRHNRANAHDEESHHGSDPLETVVDATTTSEFSIPARASTVSGR